MQEKKSNSFLQLITQNDHLKTYVGNAVGRYSEVSHNAVTLLYYAISHQNYSITKSLLELKANPNQISAMLPQLSIGQQLPIFNFFQSKIKDHTVSYEKKEVPLVLAVMMRNSDLVYLLLSHGADPLIYDNTVRDNDTYLRIAQKFVLDIRDHSESPCLSHKPSM